MGAEAICLSFWEDVEMLDEKLLLRLLEEKEVSLKQKYTVATLSR